MREGEKVCALEALGFFHSLVIEKKIPPMALCAGL